jgi:uncharacterized protein YodC (DUF2158 family)
MDVRVGSLVRLGSGGSTMTVWEVAADGKVIADWFDDDRKLRNAPFMKDQLVPLDLQELSSEQLNWIIQRLDVKK